MENSPRSAINIESDKSCARPLPAQPAPLNRWTLRSFLFSVAHAAASGTSGNSIVHAGICWIISPNGGVKEFSRNFQMTPLLPGCSHGPPTDKNLV